MSEMHTLDKRIR